jgi:hypothetical protein
MASKARKGIPKGIRMDVAKKNTSTIPAGIFKTPKYLLPLYHYFGGFGVEGGSLGICQFGVPLWYDF